MPAFEFRGYVVVEQTPDEDNARDTVDRFLDAVNQGRALNNVHLILDESPPVDVSENYEEPEEPEDD